MSTVPADLQLIAAADVPAQAWRNGGGQTRELLAWPSGDAWQVRVSRADIDRDGPFSAFPQVERWFAVLQGHGVVLQFAEGERTLGTRDAALRFDGAAAPGCRLVDGPTQDLNLMLRRARGALQRWQHGLAWPADFAQRGLYTTVAGRWRCGERTLPLPAHHLLWASAAGAGTWTFEPDTDPATGSAWWIGATLQD